MQELFSKNKVNSTRQIDLDIAKGLAILFMIIVHVNEVYQSTDLEGSLYNKIIEFIGSPPAAPVFMFLLGLGIVYSKRSTSSYLFKRGIFILILGYVLNFFRDYIPYSILAITQEDPSYHTEALTSLFGVDILQFAGLAFIFFAFIKKFKIKTKYLPLFYLLFATINLFVRDNSTGNYISDAILGLIWGTNEYSWFPFLSWIGFSIAGFMFGNLVIRCNDINYLYKDSLIYSGTALITFYLYAYINQVHFGAFGELYQETYYHHDIIGNIILILFSVFWISCIHFITKCIPNVICNTFSRWSKNINLIYCVHWILLGYSMLIFELESYGPLAVLSISVVIFILSDFISTSLSKIIIQQKTSILTISTENKQKLAK